MFSKRQLSEEIAAFVAGRLSFGAFEDWFRAESQDAQSDEENEIVFAVEGVLSQYHFENLRGGALKLELEKIV